MKRILSLASLAFVLFLIQCQSSFSQNISGVINTYAAVSKIALNDLTLTSTTGFSVGDKVLVIEMKGASVDTTNTSSFGNILSYGNAGNYEYAKIIAVNGNNITLEYPLCRTYDIPGLVQVVRVPVYNNVTINDTLTCQPWNGSSGGVLVFEVTGTLSFSSDINVSGDGFWGGALFRGWFDCSNKNWCTSSALSDGGGQKGESIAAYVLNKDGARGKLAGGGGGSNPGNSGGGGGGNGNAGGQGGFVFNGCSDSTDFGVGGLALNFNNTRAYLGSGGGGGTADNGQLVTPGTSGGGLVIINAYTVDGNNHYIHSNGVDETLITGDEGAGGGGSGGTVLLNVTNYSGSLNVEAKGGKGGDEYNNIFPGYCHGPGGGGGGGMLWVNQPSVPVSLSFNGIGGLPGMILNPASPCYKTSFGAAQGLTSAPLVNLTLPTLPVAPIAIAKNTSICGGKSVDLNPSGGSAYLYTWTPSNGLSCTACANPSASPTATTTYNVIAVNGFCVDSGKIIISVDSIFNSGTVTATRDTLCPGTESILTVSGNNTSRVQWQTGVTTGFYQNISGATDSTYTAHLTQTGYFRAIVGKGLCADTTKPYKLVLAPSPVAVFTTTNSKLTYTFNSTGSSGGITAYSWDFGDHSALSNDTNPTHTYADTGTYNVCLTVYNGSNCSFTYCSNVAVGTNNANGVNNIQNNNRWKVYPDPFNDYLLISAGPQSKPIEGIELYDVLGRVVLTQLIGEREDNPIKLNVSGLNEGVYYLKIKTADANYIQQVLKQL